MTGEHVCGVRDTEPHIEAREARSSDRSGAGPDPSRVGSDGQARPVRSDIQPALGSHMCALMATHAIGTLHVAPWGVAAARAGLRSAFPGSLTASTGLTAQTAELMVPLCLVEI